MDKILTKPLPIKDNELRNDSVVSQHYSSAKLYSKYRILQQFWRILKNCFSSITDRWFQAKTGKLMYHTLFEMPLLCIWISRNKNKLLWLNPRFRHFLKQPNLPGENLEKFPEIRKGTETICQPKIIIISPILVCSASLSTENSSDLQLGKVKSKVS